VVWNIEFFDFPYIGNVIIPADKVIFFRGVGQPPTRWTCSRFSEGPVLGKYPTKQIYAPMDPQGDWGRAKVSEPQINGCVRQGFHPQMSIWMGTMLILYYDNIIIIIYYDNIIYYNYNILWYILL
jgi:hypothetical protein